MGEAKLSHYSIADYLALDEQTEFKHEYLNGDLRAMSGGTLDHSLIGSNISGELRSKIKQKKLACSVYSSDARVYIETANAFLYPDVSVMCGEMEISEHDRNSYVNPTLIVEVLSDSTAAYDRGDKFRKYRSLVSFKEYVIIDQHQPVVDVIYREDRDYWKMSTAVGLDKSIYLHTLDCHIDLAEIYLNVTGLEETTY